MCSCGLVRGGTNNDISFVILWAQWRETCGCQYSVKSMSSYDDTLAAGLELSVQNYFSQLRALYNFNPLDVARLTDTSFSFAPNGLGLLAPVRIDFSLTSLWTSTLEWHGTIVVCILACSSHCFLSPLCTWVCVFVYTSKWYHTCLMNTLLAINILHILARVVGHVLCCVVLSTCLMLVRGGSYNCVVTLCEFSASIERLHVRGGASTNIVTLYRVLCNSCFVCT